ncbi:hypothetical protein FGADI_7401 [Fusarium gaditjirri]|uniref:Uncharacterized protein n=1 Tax=Fusarium gaditjirri TaxID=282569 RepID=A0A8H4T526_9HYPO|nr:hypothetical protein FGADI_7401 [Fusarium gaditjirri]
MSSGSEEQPEWPGTYCGAFYTTEAQKSIPFIGLALKGTSPFNLREMLDYQLVQAGVFLQVAGFWGWPPSEINGPPLAGRYFTSGKEFKCDVIHAGPHHKFTSRLLSSA